DRCDAGEASYDGVTTKRDNACLNASGAAPDTDCATRTNVVNACTTDPFTKTGCANVTTIATLRRDYCFADATLWNDRCDAGEAGYDGVTAKRDKSCLDATSTAPDTDCATRTEVVNTCTTDPFTRTGCDNVGTISTIRMDYCTKGDRTIFDSRCNESHGEVAKARAESCLSGNADFTGTNLISARCGNEETNDGNLVYTYCQSGDGMIDTTNCPRTSGTQFATNCRETNPWGTTSEPCDAATYVAFRATRCLDMGTGLPAEALIGTTRVALCAAVTTLTCEGGAGVDANPFAAICQVASNPYDDERLSLCGGAIAGLPSGVMPSACKPDNLSGRICGTADSTPGSNPFAPICSDGTAIVDGFDIDMAQKALVNGCDNKSITTGCNETITAGGRTVNACIGDPYLSGCGGVAFADVLMTRNGICSSTGSDPFSTDCANNPSITTDQQGYCAGANTWRTDCDIHRSVADVMNARATICLANGEINTGTTTAPVVAVAMGSSLFNTLCDGLQTAGGDMVLTERQEQCSDGTQSDVGLCNKVEITNVVCGSTAGTNVNPFAMVCETAIAAGSLATVQQTFCGSTPRTASTPHSVSGCNDILDTLCSGADSVATVGAASYNCLLDTTTNVATA
ncbi:MAG: hypothetical protein K8953_06345, partial [Proteobacteria bacterium]|nr:hypothetical protein [Pseudomonadota bacterium]